jgi:hypothetical protein
MGERQQFVVQPAPSRTLREAATFSVAVAAIFLLAASSCLVWLHNRGAFGAATVERAINLKTASPIDVHFSVPKIGDHDIAIWYPRTSSQDIARDLSAIYGKVTLFNGDAPVQKIELPTGHTRCGRDGCAMIVFRGPTAPRNDYSLLFEVDRMPPALVESAAVLKVELAPEYYMSFLVGEVGAAILLVLALLSGFLAIRWWRSAVNSPV